jgi:hypothetical protein
MDSQPCTFHRREPAMVLALVPALIALPPSRSGQAASVTLRAGHLE